MVSLYLLAVFATPSAVDAACNPPIGPAPCELYGVELSVAPSTNICLPWDAPQTEDITISALVNTDCSLAGLTPAWSGDLGTNATPGAVWSFVTAYTNRGPKTVTIRVTGPPMPGEEPQCSASDTQTVNVIRIEITPRTNEICSKCYSERGEGEKCPAARFELTNSWPESVTWEIAPDSGYSTNGLIITPTTNSLEIIPEFGTGGVYTVTAKSTLKPECHDTAKLIIVAVTATNIGLRPLPIVVGAKSTNLVETLPAGRAVVWSISPRTFSSTVRGIY